MAKRQQRREFLKKISIGGIVITGSSKGISGAQILKPTSFSSLKEEFGLNDQIRVGIIGCGIQGFSNARAAIQVPGVEIAAACDLYTGRLTRMKEVFGDHVKTTKDYHDILSMSDIDAVCIATTDHWHDHMLKDALKAGKPCYCEKPMMHHIDEGMGMVEAEISSNLPVIIGSQRASGIDTLKAKELFEAGVIGELNLVDIRYDRNTSNGAWQYSIPTDASPQTVDWEKFLGDAPKRAFDATRFFRWRNYQDYGTAVAGDLFVHLFTALHVITSSLGPERIYATGGLRYWKDGRDVPDITLGLYDYPATAQHPAFNVQMRVNFADGGGGGSQVRMIGSEGVMTLGWNAITIEKNPVDSRPYYGGWDSYATFSKAEQLKFEQWFKKTYPDPKPKMKSPTSMTYEVPEGYSAHVDHWANFADAIRNGSTLVEDTTFGLRAAGPALATNNSMYERRIVQWDPVKMQML